MRREKTLLIIGIIIFIIPFLGIPEAWSNIIISLGAMGIIVVSIINIKSKDINENRGKLDKVFIEERPNIDFRVKEELDDLGQESVSPDDQVFQEEESLEPIEVDLPSLEEGKEIVEEKINLEEIKEDIKIKSPKRNQTRKTKKEETSEYDVPSAEYEFVEEDIPVIPEKKERKKKNNNSVAENVL
jgi:hypothetical protein